jgi:exosome complex exonuclease RRP6
MSSSGLEELQNDTDDVSHVFDSTVDLLDHYYESVDTALDELENIYNGQEVVQKKVEVKQKPENIKVSVRPQLKWTDIDNSNRPFVPKIKEKPNATVATLQQSLKADESDPPYEPDVYFPFQMGIGMGVGGPPTRESSYHPYEPELICLEFEAWQIQKPDPPVMYKGLQNTNCVWINTVKDLYALAATLDGQKEIAIDLEQHSYRTFQGFVCLMQISTREQDYLVDTLELRENLHVLNTSFTNPKIVKVMHGSDCDILWLQRDFGLYIVNLFDTGKAAQKLGHPGLSLAYLLKYYCGVIADKKYQLSDWRVRPLPSEMVKYARQDTHYLLYIYDRLRHDLFDAPNGRENLDEVWRTSREICLRRYEKELFTETAYLNVISRAKVQLEYDQELVVRALYKWRDTVSRKEDESIRFVLPDHMMVTIAEKRPTDVQRLLSLCAPVPKLLRRDAKLVTKLVQQALKGEIDDDLITGKKSLEQKHEEELRGAMIRTPEVSRYMKLESPVLSTEQLYQAAGWVEQPVDTVSRLSFEEDDEDEDEDVLMSERTPAKSPGRSVRIQTANNSSLFHHSFSSSSSFPDFMDTEEENRAKVAEIRSSFSLENLKSPSKLFSFGPYVPAQQKFVLPKSEDNPFKTPAPVKKMETEDVSDPSRSTPPDERVPSSLNEIYKLSHKNRKRNKQKKKLKQDSVSDPSPAYDDFNASVATSSSGQNSRTSSFDSNADEEAGVADTKPVDFMKKIGWLGEDEDVADEEDEEQVEIATQLVMKEPKLGPVTKSRTRNRAYSNKQSSQYNKR